MSNKHGSSISWESFFSMKAARRASMAHKFLPRDSIHWIVLSFLFLCGYRESSVSERRGFVSINLLPKEWKRRKEGRGRCCPGWLGGWLGAAPRTKTLRVMASTPLLPDSSLDYANRSILPAADGVIAHVKLLLLILS